MGALRGAGIVKEITGQKRNRLFSYDRFPNAILKLPKRAGLKVDILLMSMVASKL
jgi:hypothetical protein